MARSANITSIDTVETLAAAVKRFQVDAANVLEDLGIQVHRAQEWVQHDRKQFQAILPGSRTRLMGMGRGYLLVTAHCALAPHPARARRGPV